MMHDEEFRNRLILVSLGLEEVALQLRTLLSLSESQPADGSQPAPDPADDADAEPVGPLFPGPGFLSEKEPDEPPTEDASPDTGETESPEPAAPPIIDVVHEPVVTPVVNSGPPVPGAWEGSDTLPPVMIPGTAAPNHVPNAWPDRVDRPIARWATVPFQHVGSPLFFVGVHAFARNPGLTGYAGGIRDVEFRANGGDWVSAGGWSRHPLTGSWGIWATVDLSDQAPGTRIDVVARITPEYGAPVLLQGADDGWGRGALTFWVAAGDAWRTIDLPSAVASMGTIEHVLAQAANVAGRADVSGLRIMVPPGDYYFGGRTSVWTARGWATLDCSRGARIVSSKNTGFGGLRLHVWGAHIVGDVTFADSVWLDNSTLQGPGATKDHRFLRHVPGRQEFVTACAVSDTRRGVGGADAIHNCRFDRLANALGATLHATDINAADLDKYTGPGKTFHSDLLHRFTPGENMILMNVVAEDVRSQGIYMQQKEEGVVPLRDVAVVNLAIEAAGNTPGGTWWDMNTTNGLMWGLSVPNQPWRFQWTRPADGQGHAPNGFALRSSVLQTLSHDRLPPNADVGDLVFRGPIPTNGYKMGEVPSTTETDAFVPFDAYGNPRDRLTVRGAFAFAQGDTSDA